VTGTAPTALARRAVERLFDDAALFPPARAPMEAALGLHALAARSSWGFTQGRFLVPIGALDRFVAERRHLDYLSPLEIGVIVGSPADPDTPAPLDEVLPAVRRVIDLDRGVSVALVEYRPGDQTAEGLRIAARHLAEVVGDLGAAGFVEVTVTGGDADDIPERVAALDGNSVGAKVRCGGVDPTMIPTPEAVARFVAACVQHDLPFKATAGLHHALSAADPDRRFGYLNLLVATVLAHRGADVATIADALAIRDASGVHATPDTLHFGRHEASRVDLSAARSHFVAFGTCSFTEPLADLLAVPGLTTEDR
jgi:hypothetical protein